MQKANANQTNKKTNMKQMEKWYLMSRLSTRKTTFVISGRISKKEECSADPAFQQKRLLKILSEDFPFPCGKHQ